MVVAGAIGVRSVDADVDAAVVVDAVAVDDVGPLSLLEL